MSILNTIYEKIAAAERIMLFRHIRVDGDCVGATKGLKAAILATWPEKEVYIIDDERSEYLAFLDGDDESVEDALYQDALGIVIDVSNRERISNQKYALCREVIKIDHHIPVEAYGHINWVEENRSSACEMIVHLCHETGMTITKEAATCLYTGMVTDSGRFLYEGVNGDTLRLAGLLLDTGVDVERLYAHLYLRDFNGLKFKAHIYEHMQLTDNGVAYIHVTRAMQEQFALSFESACTAVSALSDIRGVLCWLAFIDTAEGPIRVRLRSRFTAINGIAEKYHGGGHANASGATVFSTEEMEALIRDADEHVRDYKATHEDWL